MREILYKNLTGSDNRKQDLCIREVIMQKDCTATVERRCIYFVRERIYVEDPSDLEKLKKLKENNEAWKKRHFHILRNHDTCAGEDKLLCKVAGTFFAVVEHYVFCIAFIHSFKVDLVPIKQKKT